MEEANTNDLSPEYSDKDYIIYHNFIMNNLDLITNVLLFLNNRTNLFMIDEGHIISY